jgi:hypothetical protein
VIAEWQRRSPRRSAVLALDPETDIPPNWTKAVDALAAVPRYDNAARSNTEQDVQGLTAWLRGEGPDPETISGFAFEPTRGRDVTGRQRALYRTTIALSMRHAPLDFHEAKPLNKPIIDGHVVDDPHLPAEVPFGFRADRCRRQRSEPHAHRQDHQHTHRWQRPIRVPGRHEERAQWCARRHPEEPQPSAGGKRPSGRTVSTISYIGGRTASPQS